jgi:hypothetical protein
MTRAAAVYPRGFRRTSSSQSIRAPTTVLIGRALDFTMEPADTVTRSPKIHELKLVSIGFDATSTVRQFSYDHE